MLQLILWFNNHSTKFWSFLTSQSFCRHWQK